MNFRIIRNDITNMDVDAIVLPANESLKEGSGTSAAIFEKAGRKELANACEKERKNGVNIGSAIPTLGYKLSSKYIIHAIVPKWKDGNHKEYELLSAAYLSALTLADQLQCKSLAFPLLASGNNKFDTKLALEIAVNSINEYEAKKELEEVYLVVYDRNSTDTVLAIGYEVEEIIDESYVLKNKDSLKTPLQKSIHKNVSILKDVTKEIGKDYVEDVKEKVIESAKSYINNPETRKKILNSGIKITAKAIKKSITKM